MKNTQCQETASARAPPRTGPNGTTRAVTADHAPTAAARRSGAKLAFSRARLAGVRRAAAIPCPARPAMSCKGVWASPHAIDASAKRIIPSRKTLRLP